MTSPSTADVLAAANRLRGHLVQTPMLGGVAAGVTSSCDVRWKADLLQPGGSSRFRGYLHLLQRKLGSLPGLSYCGPLRHALAAAAAARLHRLPMQVFCSVEPEPSLRHALGTLDAAVAPVADPLQQAALLQRRAGWLPLPDVEHPDVLAGVATVGFEMAQALPADCAEVFAPCDLRGAVEAGLQAAGRPIVVHGVATPEGDAAQALCAAVLCSHQIALSERGCGALLLALRGTSGVVGALVAD
jgi:threonine dehydratase